MSPEFAAKALLGGHHDIVHTVIRDVEGDAERAFYLLRLTEELTYLVGPQRANKIVRRFR